MRARLFSPSSELPVNHEFTEEVTLGRGPTNSLSLDSRLLSGFHARITWDAELACYRLKDMGSTNGTRLDGRRVEDALLGHLHVVTLADQLDIVFQDLDRCAARQQAHSVQAPHGGQADRAFGTTPAVEMTQHTSIQSLAIALPELLRAPGAQSAPGGGSKPGSQVSEGTLMERMPLPLPSFLRSPQDPPATEPPPEAQDDGLVDPPSGPLDVSPLPASSIIPDAAKVPRATSEIPPTREISDDDPLLQSPIEVDRLPAGQDDIFFLAAHSPAGTIHYELGEGTNVIGRAMDAEVRIDSPEVSRKHAQITLQDGRMTLRDLGSRNRTFVNGEPLEKEPVHVMPGQRLRFGALEVMLGVTAAKPQGDGR